VTIHELVLDPVTDANAVPRTITFTSDGPGHVSVELTSATTIANAKLCLAAGSAQPECRTGIAPEFPDELTTAEHATWTVTLASADESTPIVDLAISWPAASPSMTLSDGRFQGTPNTDALRSFSATFVARTAGSARLEASWKPGAAAAGLTLAKGAYPGTVVDRASYAAGTSIAPAWTHAVAGGATYTVTLMNTSADSVRTSLTATLAFP